MTNDAPRQPASRPSRSPNPWRIVGAVLTVLAMGAGFLSAASQFALHTENQQNTYHRSVDRIVIDADIGAMTLRPGGSAVRLSRTLTWTWTRPTIAEAWDGTSLRIQAHCGFPADVMDCEVDYAIELPPDVSVSAHTFAGDIDVLGLRGELSLSSSTGDITVSQATGTITMDGGTGDIRATQLGSAVASAHTTTGDIAMTFTSAPTHVAATAGTVGNVSLMVPPGQPYHTRVKTLTGAATVTVSQDPTSGHSIDASTTTGDITIAYG